MARRGSTSPISFLIGPWRRWTLAARIIRSALAKPTSQWPPNHHHILIKAGPPLVLREGISLLSLYVPLRRRLNGSRADPCRFWDTAFFHGTLAADDPAVPTNEDVRLDLIIAGGALVQTTAPSKVGCEVNG